MNKKLLPILLSVLLMVALLFSSCAMDGADGKDGIDGKDGKDGITPTIEISEDGYWVINGEKTDVPAKGEQGDSASPVDENPQGLAFYLKDDGTYAVEIGYAKYLSRIEIPSTYKGKPVTEVGVFCDQNQNKILKEIVIPDSVTTIGDNAFYNCVSITSITIPNSVTSIGDRAFTNCSNLASVVIGNGVISIGDYAFQMCEGLTEITIPNSVTSIGDSTFTYCTSLTSVEIPGSVTSIGNDAFYGCTSLTSVVIPDSVTSIGISAFGDCTSLTSIAIPSSVTSIGYNAFNRCYKLAEVINKSSLNITEGSADYGYAAYYAIEVHSGESKIEKQNDYLFYTYNGVNYLLGYVGSDTELVLPTSYNGANYEIYQYAFYKNDKITSVVIPDSVTRIGERAFYSCYSLTIYCEAASRPGRWDSRWNDSGCPVVWGYKG